VRSFWVTGSVCEASPVGRSAEYAWSTHPYLEGNQRGGTRGREMLQSRKRPLTFSFCAKGSATFPRLQVSSLQV